MSGSIPAASTREAAAEGERVVAWLRLPAIVLLALGEGLAHPNPEKTAFAIALILFSAWSWLLHELAPLGSPQAA